MEKEKKREKGNKPGEIWEKRGKIGHSCQLLPKCWAFYNLDGAKTDPGFDPNPSDKIFEYALKHYHMKPGNSGGQGVQGIVGAVDEGDEGRLCQHVQPEGRLVRS